MYKILIVEDETNIAELLAEHLKKWGFAVDLVSDFSDVEGQFLASKPDLVLLDISLPFYNGYYWCDRIRKISNVPIVFLSSHAENMDIIMAMNMGGDDYITKPFSLDVATAKIQAMLRRTYRLHSEPQTLAAGEVVLNLNDATICYKGAKVELSKNEFKIMQTLLENKNQVVTREQLMKRLWDSDSFIDDNTLTVNVKRLRRRLEEAGIYDLIATKKGMGYIIHD
ncbi:MAG: response regulator transcription factor [Firmicutes bacterium]|nr:response regulator transcription factor [Bacillota bacterium]